MATTEPFIERFWNQIEKTEHCWLWNGKRDRNGYGRTYYPAIGKCVFTHRLTWQLVHGEIHGGLCVLHDCRPLPDNHACCRPSHLWLGTNKENSADAVRKNQMPHGEAHWRSKLTAQMITEILESYATGTVTQSQLAGRYRVSLSTINMIVNRHRWKREGGAVVLDRLHISKSLGIVKLDLTSVARIRSCYLEGNISQAELAKQFGVDHSLISLVVRHKIWNV